MFSTLISAAQLQASYQAQTWAIVDCRAYLSDVTKGRALYQTSHLPDAVFMDMETDLSSPVTPVTGRHPLPDMGVLCATLGRLGIDNQTQVVVYDDMQGAMAGRLWWLLRHLGHEAVAVLDGGFQAWQHQGGELTAEIPTPSVTTFTPTDSSFNYLTTDALRETLADLQLIDARAKERYEGKVEPIDPVAGHIPSAFNHPFSQNLQDNGCFKPAAELAAQWRALLNGKPVVHMCGSGVTACHNLLAMEHAGLGVSALYAGSWSEWIRHADNPIATINEAG